MKWIARGAIALLALALLAPMVMAQEEHGEAGIYADYTRFHNLKNQNFWGVGGRVAFNLNRYAQLEASMAYDFERNFTTATSNTFNTTFQNTKFRMLEGMFGPKLQTGAGPFKLFGTVKAGFQNFSVTNSGVFTGFTGAVSNVPEGNTHFALYPGGGIELFAHWIGIRAEIGDQIYWENGANHNLKFSVGPQFRW